VQCGGVKGESDSAELDGKEVGDLFIYLTLATKQRRHPEEICA
jgi:hypothetical protein